MPSVAEWVVPRALSGPALTPHRGVPPQEPSPAQRCEWGCLHTSPSPSSLCTFSLCYLKLNALLVSLQETLLLEWVNPMYLDISYQEQIQEEFEESAEIQLKDFLKVSLLLYWCYFYFLFFFFLRHC